MALNYNDRIKASTKQKTHTKLRDLESKNLVLKPHLLHADITIKTSLKNSLLAPSSILSADKLQSQKFKSDISCTKPNRSALSTGLCELNTSLKSTNLSLLNTQLHIKAQSNLSKSTEANVRHQLSCSTLLQSSKTGRTNLTCQLARSSDLTCKLLSAPSYTTGTCRGNLINLTRTKSLGLTPSDSPSKKKKSTPASKSKANKKIESVWEIPVPEYFFDSIDDGDASALNYFEFSDVVSPGSLTSSVLQETETVKVRIMILKRVLSSCTMCDSMFLLL